MSMTSLAQTSSEPSDYCGTDELTEEQREFLNVFQQNIKKHMGELPEATIYVPVKIHSVGETSGIGHMAKADILRNLCDLNTWYQPVNFHFYLYGTISHINNSTYYNHTGGFTGATMMKQNNVEDVVNIYIVNDPAGNCGYFSGFGDGIALRKSCLGQGSTTMAHEVGHYFSLPHTFNGWEQGTPPTWDRELVDGSNCTQAGDGFCDTYPDYLANRWNCPYNGPALVDPNGDTLVPDGTNIMAYSNDECQDHFSAQQNSAMRGYLLGARNYLTGHDLPSLNTTSPTSLTFPGDAIGGVRPDGTRFTWSKVDQATHYHLQISRIPIVLNNVVDVVILDTTYLVTDLNPGTKYYWKVEAFANGDICADNNSAIQSFTTGWSTGVEEPTELQEIQVYPNPSRKGQLLTVDIGSAVFNGSITLTNLQGQTMSIHAINGATVQIPTAALASGIYLIQVNTDEGFRTERIVIN